MPLAEAGRRRSRRVHQARSATQPRAMRAAMGEIDGALAVTERARLNRMPCVDTLMLAAARETNGSVIFRHLSKHVHTVSHIPTNEI